MRLQRVRHPLEPKHVGYYSGDHLHLNKVVDCCRRARRRYPVSELRRALRCQAQGTLDFSGQHQLQKHAGRIDIIFTRLVDYTNEIVCVSIWVIQKGVQLSDLN